MIWFLFIYLDHELKSDKESKQNKNNSVWKGEGRSIEEVEFLISAIKKLFFEPLLTFLYSV